MDCGEEISSGFVVAGSNGAVLLELTEEILDEVACLVGVFVEIALNLAVALLGGITTDFPLASNGSITRSSASKALSASKASAAISGSSASAPSRSWAWPGVRMKSSGLPNASTSA